MALKKNMGKSKILYSEAHIQKKAYRDLDKMIGEWYHIYQQVLQDEYNKDIMDGGKGEHIGMSWTKPLSEKYWQIKHCLRHDFANDYDIKYYAKHLPGHVKIWFFRPWRLWSFVVLIVFLFIIANKYLLHIDLGEDVSYRGRKPIDLIYFAFSALVILPIVFFLMSKLDSWFDDITYNLSKIGEIAAKKM